ncbi:unnamed protein product [Mytilus coruscus]|uniref:Uncharacterized protein n=1 Tax=Mytilus coruscus TaxID=42192 RepID=A0A6J8BDQ6_MYTCO|nr:unnamed protein product [Mytilus coruscus]
MAVMVAQKPQFSNPSSTRGFGGFGGFRGFSRGRGGTSRRGGRRFKEEAFGALPGQTVPGGKSSTYNVDYNKYKGIVYAGFVLYGLMITTSLVLIPGIQLDKRYLLLPWIYMLILNVLYETGSVALLPTVHMEREKTLHAWEIIWVFFYCFKLIANCYCFACVVSQYQELSEGRGTYEYLYKPHFINFNPSHLSIELDVFQYSEHNEKHQMFSFD